MEKIIVLYAFGGLGILDTLYLIYHKVKGTDVYCLFFQKEWCQKVQYSSWSKTFGISNSYAGFCMYSAILVLTYLFTNSLIAFSVIQALVIFGFLFSMYFTFIQAFVLKAFCTWCLISAINFSILFFSALLL